MDQQAHPTKTTLPGIGTRYDLDHRRRQARLAGGRTPTAGASWASTILKTTTAARTRVPLDPAEAAALADLLIPAPVDPLHDDIEIDLVTEQIPITAVAVRRPHARRHPGPHPDRRVDRGGPAPDRRDAVADAGLPVRDRRHAGRGRDPRRRRRRRRTDRGGLSDARHHRPADRAGRGTPCPRHPRPDRRPVRVLADPAVPAGRARLRPRRPAAAGRQRGVRCHRRRDRRHPAAVAARAGVHRGRSGRHAEDAVPVRRRRLRAERGARRGRGAAAGLGTGRGGRAGRRHLDLVVRRDREGASAISAGWATARRRWCWGSWCSRTCRWRSTCRS